MLLQSCRSWLQSVCFDPFSENYFIPVSCFLLFNVMDWAGRSLTAFCMWVSKSQISHVTKIISEVTSGSWKPGFKLGLAVEPIFQDWWIAWFEAGLCSFVFAASQIWSDDGEQRLMLAISPSPPPFYVEMRFVSKECVKEVWRSGKVTGFLRVCSFSRTSGWTMAAGNC